MRYLLVVVFLAGCRSVAYQPGSFTGVATSRSSRHTAKERLIAGPRGSFQGERKTVGCLDVAVAEMIDARARGPVAGLTIANRCDRDVSVDIGAIGATARRSGGSEVRLAAYDPAGEIRPVILEGRRVVSEYIEFLPVDRGDVRFSSWCVDLSRLARLRPSDRPAMVCFFAGGPS